MEFPNNFKMIFKFIGGSNLYGTNTKDSDIDERGVFIPSEKYFFGFLNRIEQLQDKQKDIEYHDIRKFLKLALDNNPNIVEYLFIPKNKWIISTDEWIKIIENKDYFLSKKCKYTFSGYAHSQFLKVKRHRSWLLNPPKKKPKRKDFGLLENRSTIPKDQIGAFNVLLSMYLEEIRSFHSLKDQILEMEETHNFKAMTQQMKKINLESVKNIIPISNNFLEILEKEKAYLNAKKYWDSYQNWKSNRNLKRSKSEEKFGFDTKHMSHLFRLMSEGEELLTTEFITFPRPDAEFLLDIRNGKYSYEELTDMIGDYDNKFDKLYETSNLPNKPNRKIIDKLCINIVKDFLNKN